MSTPAHIYFATMRLVYSLSTRRDKGFVILEAAGALITLMFAIVGSRMINLGGKLPGPTEMAFVAAIGLMFFLTSIGSRMIFKKNPVEVAETEATRRVTPVGIIDFCWLIMMGGIYGSLIFCQFYPTLNQPLPKGRSDAFYGMYFNEVQFLFSRTLDVIFLLGTVLVACMGILWAGQLWAKKDAKSRLDYQRTTLASVKMVIAYVAIAVAVAIWVANPLYVKMTMIKGLLQ